MKKFMRMVFMIDNNKVVDAKSSKFNDIDECFEVLRRKMK